MYAYTLLQNNQRFLKVDFCKLYVCVSSNHTESLADGFLSKERGTLELWSTNCTCFIQMQIEHRNKYVLIHHHMSSRYLAFMLSVASEKSEFTTGKLSTENTRYTAFYHNTLTWSWLLSFFFSLLIEFVQRYRI